MLSDYVLPRPQEGPQTQFSQIRDDVYMVFYGGARIPVAPLLVTIRKQPC